MASFIIGIYSGSLGAINDLRKQDLEILDTQIFILEKLNEMRGIQ